MRAMTVFEDVILGRGEKVRSEKVLVHRSGTWEGLDNDARTLSSLITL